MYSSLKILRIGIAVLISLAAGMARAQDTAGQDPDRGTVDYLALGDSIPFGDDGFVPKEPEDRPDISVFVGYADYLGSWHFGGRYRNLSCPGETTGSFLDVTVPDFGCQIYKAKIPLKAAYSGSQIDAAEELIRKNPQMQLITLTLIGNDYFLLLQRCMIAHEDNPDGLDKCLVDGASATINKAAKNLKISVRRLKQAGFKGKILVSNLYTINLRETPRLLIIAAGNMAIAAAVTSEGAKMVDFFSRFTREQWKVGGDGCKTGFLIPNPLSPVPEGDLVCDVHPSQLGSRALAYAVWWRFKQWF